MFHAKTKVIAYGILSAMIFSSTVFPSTANGLPANIFLKDLPANLVTANNLNTATFETPEGKIKVYLPDDIRPGDTISGSVVELPRGNNEIEKRQNSSALRRYAVSVEKTRTTVSDSLIKLGVPENLKNKTLSLVLITPEGKEVSKLQIATNNTPENNMLRDFQLPSIGQTGRPVAIPGNFDGDLSNTKCALGSEAAIVLAESPRKTVFESPSNVIGVTEIKMKERNIALSGVFRNVGIGLAAPKTNLMKGESTSLTVTVQGLQGLTTNVPIVLVSTGTINMSGGNTQTLLISPGQVQSGGIFTQIFTMTATQAGAFSVNATVITGNPTTGGDQAQCECQCEAQPSPITQALKRAIKGGGTTYTYAPNFKTKCAGSKCTMKVTYVWSIGKASTAAYTIRKGTDTENPFVVDVTGSGTLEITVTTTVSCSPGGTCSATGTKTFDVTK